MNYKKIEKEIKKSLDNLDCLKITNTLKAQAIMEAITPHLETPEFFEHKPFKILRKSNESSN